MTLPPAADDEPLAVHRPAAALRLRDALDRAEFTEDRLREYLHAGSVMALHLQSWDVPLVWHRTRDGTPLDSLVRLFLCGGPVDIEAVRTVIPPAVLEECVELRLLRIDGRSVAAAVGLIPYQGLILAWDLMWYQRPFSNAVMGLGPTSLLLAQLTVRRPARSTLDLCTGGGFQAFQAAAHSGCVVGVDANPRAINLARFNAQLNRLANVHFLEGPLLEPVHDQSFDLVVANPPFVISPENRLLLRDSGLTRDRLTESVVRSVPRHLNEGGYAQILCNWAHVEGEDWRARLAGWLAESGCDAWVLRFRTDEPARYSREWLCQTDERAAAFAARFPNWMAYFEQERIEAISYGLITLRRVPGRPNWFACDDAPPLHRDCGVAIQRGFALRDFLHRLAGDAALLQTTLRVAPELRCHNAYQLDRCGWARLESRIELAEGLGWIRTANVPVLELLGNCRGDRSLGSILASLAASHGLDPASAAQAFLPLVRRLVEQGFLLPPALAPQPCPSQGLS